MLQIFLLINVFLVGVAVAFAVQYAYAHHRHKNHAPAKRQPEGIHLPLAVRERLLQEAQGDFQAALDHSAAGLQQELQSTIDALNAHLEKLGSDIIVDEMKHYHMRLDQLREQAEHIIGNSRAEVDKHQSELKVQMDAKQAEMETKLAEEIAAEKQLLLQQIDTKLADAAASFLIETLQHNVDLGAQTKYLTATLEEHKDDFKREVADEAPAAK